MSPPGNVCRSSGVTLKILGRSELCLPHVFDHEILDTVNRSFAFGGASLGSVRLVLLIECLHFHGLQLKTLTWLVVDRFDGRSNDGGLGLLISEPSPSIQSVCPDYRDSQERPSRQIAINIEKPRSR